MADLESKRWSLILLNPSLFVEDSELYFSNKNVFFFLLFYLWMFPEIGILEVNIYCLKFSIMNSRVSLTILGTEIFEGDSRKKK